MEDALRRVAGKGDARLGAAALREAKHFCKEVAQLQPLMRARCERVGLLAEEELASSSSVAHSQLLCAAPQCVSLVKDCGQLSVRPLRTAIIGLLAKQEHNPGFSELVNASLLAAIEEVRRLREQQQKKHHAPVVGWGAWCALLVKFGVMRQTEEECGECGNCVVCLTLKLHERGEIYWRRGLDSVVLDQEFLSRAMRRIISYRHGFPERVSVTQVMAADVLEGEDEPRRTENFAVVSTRGSGSSKHEFLVLRSFAEFEELKVALHASDDDSSKAALQELERSSSSESPKRTSKTFSRSSLSFSGYVYTLRESTAEELEKWLKELVSMPQFMGNRALRNFLGIDNEEARPNASWSLRRPLLTPSVNAQ